MRCNRGECFENLKQNKVKSPLCNEENCIISCDERAVISVKENKKNYVLYNDEGNLIAVFQVDEGMIKDKSVMRCDKLILDITGMRAVFVELKGTDLRHAIEQIEASINKIGPELKDYLLLARIVTSSRTNVPNLKTYPQYVRLAKKLPVLVGVNKIEEKLSVLK